MPAPRLDKATLQRMLLAYIVDPNPTHVARECGVSWSAAKKYITEGAPSLGIGAFAVEARRILRAGDKIVRLTEVTKEIRVQVEEKDLGAYQDLLFEFEDIIHEAMALFKARITREKAYFSTIEETAAAGAPAAVTDKIKRPPPVHLGDLKAIAVGLSHLMTQKREFWDRMEIVRRTEVEVGGGAEGLSIVETEAPPDFERWEPHEIASYVESVEAGQDPVYPDWHQTESAENRPEKTDGYRTGQQNSASGPTEKTDPGKTLQGQSVIFPPGGEGPED